MITTTADIEGFRAVVDHARDGSSADLVAGLPPSLVVEPESAEVLAATLAEASARGLAVVARGAGTKLDWGRRPSRVDVLLDTGGLTGVVDVTPGDFVAIVRAGAPLGALQAELGEATGGQRIPLDPPYGNQQTIGGIVAAAAAGRLRHRYGSPRDLVLGVQFALADGTLARAGSKVVKNVAGYDISKLLCGSLGTLAVICELIVKLQPAPERTLSLSSTAGDRSELVTRVEAIRATRLPLAALELSLPDNRIDVLIESTAAGAEATARRLGEVVPLVEAELATGDPGPTGPVAHVGFPTGRLAGLLDTIAADTHALVRLGAGVAEIALPTDRERVQRLRSAVEGIGGQLTLRGAPVELDDLVFGTPDPGAALLGGRIKHQLDPTDTLAPGRLEGWTR